MMGMQMLLRDYKYRFLIYLPKYKRPYLKKFSFFVLQLLFLVTASGGGTAQLYAQQHLAHLDSIEVRLHNIFEKGAYWSKGVPIEWLPDGSAHIISKDDVKYKVDVLTGKETQLTDNELELMKESLNQSPDKTMRHVIRDGNIFVSFTDQSEERRITDYEQPKEVEYWGITWSPDSKYMTFIEGDLTAVPKRSMLVSDDPSYPTVIEEHFARVGSEIPKLRVGIANLVNGNLTWVQLDYPQEGCYFGQIEWSAGELSIEYLSRFRDYRKIVLADPENGETRTIFEEKDSAWVDASQELNSGIEWMDGGNRFLVIHERSGWRHAYVYSRDGKQLFQLTKGDFDIIRRNSIDEENGWFYFYASPDNATQRYLYRVPLNASTNAERMTPETKHGWHSYIFAPGHQHAFHISSSFDDPPIWELIEWPSHRTLRVLEDNAALRERNKADGFRETEFLQINIGNDVTLDAWLMKPANFDPSKKYPVLVYVYSEPHSQTVLDNYYQSSEYHRIVSDLGYFILSIDSRGTPSPKGAAWRRAVFGSLGPLSTSEQAEALREVGRQRSYIDLTRVGIWGWSGGGSNTLNAMFREPALYKVGIAVASKPQPWLYNAWFQEMYMRTREVNPQGYEQSAPINFAEGLKGDLLIIHGSGEDNTHIQIVEGLVDRLIKLGKRFDYMVYPNRRHGISEGEGTTVHLYSLMIRYLLDHLESGPK
jgi:dipeptidyl-peptidase 4